MTRSISFVFRTVIGLAVLSSSVALADDPPASPPATDPPPASPPPTPPPTPPPPAPPAADAPTAAQLEQAKKAFAEGKKLYDEGKYAEAVEKFKESYRLSKNPLLLYNIAFTFDGAKEEDMALFYYRKFLKDSPPDAAQREAVVERVKVLEKQFNPGAPDPSAPADQSAKRPDGPKQPVVIKPPGTYSATDFEHQVVETAPPAKPLDVTAFVPEDSGFTVTLYFRTAGEGKFTSKDMFWRYKELVGRIPAPKMIGNAVQYYIEVKDQAGTLVTRSGKSTSPNLVNLEAGATPRFYPDLNEQGDARVSDEEIRSRDEEDDPLNKGKKKPPKKVAKDDDETKPAVVVPTGPRTGFTDVGSKKFNYAKWGSTGAGGAMLGLSLVFYLQAGKYGRSLTADATSCGTPPCRPFDDYAADVQATGKRYQTMSGVMLGFGIATGAVASYFWYREVMAKRRGERQQAAKPGAQRGTASIFVAPAVGDGFAGATAAARF